MLIYFINRAHKDYPATLMHPVMRFKYQSVLVSVCCFIQTSATCSHKPDLTENHVLIALVVKLDSHHRPNLICSMSETSIVALIQL